MTATELKSYTVGGTPEEGHGGGELRTVVEGEDWRAAGGFTLEADSEEDIEEVAEKIIEALQEAGDVDEL